MITVIAKRQAREGKEAEMRAASEKMVAAAGANEPIVRDPGCVRFPQARCVR